MAMELLQGTVEQQQETIEQLQASVLDLKATIMEQQSSIQQLQDSNQKLQMTGRNVQPTKGVTGKSFVQQLIQLFNVIVVNTHSSCMTCHSNYAGEKSQTN